MKIRVKPGAYKKLHDLGPDVLSRIDGKLTSGESGLDVARWLQEDCGVLKDMKLYSLKKAIERYRGTELRNKVIERIAGAQTRQPISVIAKRLNALEELEEMARIQRGRVDKLLTHEAGLPAGILLNAASGEIRLLKEMLVDLGRVQLETGLIPRAAKTFKGTFTNENGEVREFLWTEEQEKLYRELEGVEEHAAEDA